MIGIIEGALNIGMKYLESQDKKEQLALDTVKSMLESKTYRFVDAVVKLAYASEQITKGLIRPVFSIVMFIWGVMNPDELMKLHELGTMGDVGIATVFGAAPAWGYSRHKEKQKPTPPVSELYDS